MGYKSGVCLAELLVIHVFYWAGHNVKEYLKIDRELVESRKPTPHVDDGFSAKRHGQVSYLCD